MGPLPALSASPGRLLRLPCRLGLDHHGQGQQQQQRRTALLPRPQQPSPAFSFSCSTSRSVSCIALRSSSPSPSSLFSSSSSLALNLPTQLQQQQQPPKHLWHHLTRHGICRHPPFGRPARPIHLSRPHSTTLIPRAAASSSSPSPVAGAASRLADALKPRGAAESDSLPASLREAVLAAVDRLAESGKSGGGSGAERGRVRVTVGDVASKAGLGLAETEKALKALLADSGGFLEVSDEGDVLYVFPQNARSAVAQRSLRMKIAPVVEKAKEVGGYVARVTFGTALLASIAVVYAAIFVLLSSSRSDNDNRNNRGGGGFYPRFGGGPGIFFDISDLFWYWDPFYYRSLRYRLQKREMTFFESVFSFVFGDGDPNEGLDEIRWRTIGDIITRKGGVVAAEELAPYLDLPKDKTDESYMLPVLQRFDGTPEVDEQGNILYRFPMLQRTAQEASASGGARSFGGWAGAGSGSSSSSSGGGGSFWGLGGGSSRESGGSSGSSLASAFIENLWSFSNAPKAKQFLAAGLGVLNFVGVVVLSSLLRDPALVRQAGSEFVLGVASLMPFLQAYAVAFFAIPAVRWFLLERRNDAIRDANLRREERALELARPTAPLRRKLLNAREQASRTVLSEDRVIYTTERDVDEQKVEQREWDRKLRDKGRR